MSVLTVTISHMGKRIQIPLDTSEPPIVFKAQLMTLTNVDVDKQMVIIKGKILKDTWDDINVSESNVMMLIEKQEEQKPTKPKPMLLKDSKRPAQITENKFKNMLQKDFYQKMRQTYGLCNFGNTCYLNAVLQCFRVIPELHESLFDLSHVIFKSPFEPRGKLNIPCGINPHSLRYDVLIKRLQDFLKAVAPSDVENGVSEFLYVLREIFPLYRQINEKERYYLQHDAHEFMVQLMTVLNEVMYFKPSNLKDNKFINTFFGVKIHAKTWNETEQFESEEIELHLTCIISKSVDTMLAGIKRSLTAQLHIYSDKHHDDREYTRDGLFKRLPAYLIVQFNRFSYREDTQNSAKILKKVTFPDKLDLSSLCTPELQERMKPYKKLIDDFDMEHKEEEDMFLFKENEHLPYWFEDDMGSNCSGQYKLMSVITHMGRSAESGHYVAWVRKNETEWIMADDQDLSTKAFDDIMKLSGGLSDWHTAYVVIYARRNIPKV